MVAKMGEALFPARIIEININENLAVTPARFDLSQTYVLILFNPFLANVPILYPLKTPESIWFSGIFRGHKMAAVARIGLLKLRSNDKL